MASNHHLSPKVTIERYLSATRNAAVNVSMRRFDAAEERLVALIESPSNVSKDSVCTLMIVLAEQSATLHRIALLLGLFNARYANRRALPPVYYSGPV